MSSVLKKLRKSSAVLGNRGDMPVLVVRPHKQEGKTFESTSQFLAKALKRGIADYLSLSSSSPELARNKAIEDFMHSRFHKKKTHIFFLDDDSTPCDDFVIETLLRLNKPVVAGVTPIMRKKEGINFNSLKLRRLGIVQNEDIKNILYYSPIIMNEDGKLENIGIDELPETPFIAHRTGGTYLLIRREVLEKIKPPYQKFEFDEKQINLLRSEDIYFSDKIRQAGYDIWIDPKCVCHHFHTQDILDTFGIAMEAWQQGYDEARKEFKIVK